MVPDCRGTATPPRDRVIGTDGTVRTARSALIRRPTAEHRRRALTLPRSGLAVMPARSPPRQDGAAIGRGRCERSTIARLAPWLTARWSRGHPRPRSACDDGAARRSLRPVRRARWAIQRSTSPAPQREPAMATCDANWLADPPARTGPVTVHRSSLDREQFYCCALRPSAPRALCDSRAERYGLISVDRWVPPSGPDRRHRCPDGVQPVGPFGRRSEHRPRAGDRDRGGRTGADPSLLVVEVTETALLGRHRVGARVRRAVGSWLPAGAGRFRHRLQQPQLSQASASRLPENRHRVRPRADLERDRRPRRARDRRPSPGSSTT